MRKESVLNYHFDCSLIYERHENMPHNSEYWNRQNAIICPINCNMREEIFSCIFPSGGNKYFMNLTDYGTSIA